MKRELALAMALAAGLGGAETPLDLSAPLPRPGKWKGRRPHHSSRRFVAMDKREARKARRRR